jgi:hypothetical protein
MKYFVILEQLFRNHLFDQKYGIIINEKKLVASFV